MACYMGCATKRNKMLWGIISLLMLLSAILIAIGMSKVPACRRKMPPQCAANLARSRQSPQLVDPDCRKQLGDCLRPWVIMAAVGVVALATALVIMCFMCCCNKTPKQEQQMQQMQGLQMGQVTTAYNPYQQTYDQQQQQQQPQRQQQMPPHHGFAAGSPYNYPAGQQPQQPQQQGGVQAPPQGYPFLQQQLSSQSSQQQQQQQGGRFQQPYPATPFMAVPASQQQQLQQPQQQQPYPPAGPQPYPGQPVTGNVPVQHF